MTTIPKVLIDAKYAANVLTTELSAISSGKVVIIDKFTATNNDGSARTIDVHLVPDGGAADATNKITSALSIAAGASVDLPELKNHMLKAGDLISVVASVASMVVIRASGREVTL